MVLLFLLFEYHCKAKQLGNTKAWQYICSTINIQNYKVEVKRALRTLLFAWLHPLISFMKHFCNYENNWFKIQVSCFRFCVVLLHKPFVCMIASTHFLYDWTIRNIGSSPGIKLLKLTIVNMLFQFIYQTREY